MPAAVHASAPKQWRGGGGSGEPCRVSSARCSTSPTSAAAYLHVQCRPFEVVLTTRSALRSLLIQRPASRLSLSSFLHHLILRRSSARLRLRKEKPLHRYHLSLKFSSYLLISFFLFYSFFLSLFLVWSNYLCMHVECLPCVSRVSARLTRSR